MATIYIRGAKLWARYKKSDGTWGSATTGYAVGQEAKALRFAKTLESTEEARAGVLGDERGPLTLALYATKWIAGRRSLKLRCAGDDDARLRLHVLPVLGHMPLGDVRPRHLRDLVLALRAKAELAPRTIRHVYGTLSTLFKTAVADELIEASPCVVVRGVLPKKQDKDPEWRSQAIFSRDEIERLVSDLRIPEDRRVLYALKGVAGLRHGEAGRQRWRHYAQELEPLGGLHLGVTKTGVPRAVPVHPTLAAILAEWKLGGWERVYGRAPEPDDLIVPTRAMTERAPAEAQNAFLDDLEELGLRRRRGHDLRRSFITLAQVDGARRDLLEAVTHGPRGDIVSVYTSFPWPALCAEVAKLKIERRTGQVISADFATVLATRSRSARKRWTKEATPTGHFANWTIEIPISLVALRAA